MGSLFKLHWCYAGRFYPVYSSNQYALKFRFFSSISEYPEVSPDKFHSLRHAKCTSAIVEISYGNSPQERSYLPGQACKTQNLCIKRKCIPAYLTQFSLSLMAILLRHKQNSVSLLLLHSLLNFPVDRCRFSRPRLSGDHSEHFHSPNTIYT